MSNKPLLLLTMLLPSLILGCARPLSPQEMAIIPSSPVYYTQFTLYADKSSPYERNYNFHTTNYRIGSLLPINTEVTLLSIDKDEALVQLAATGETLTIENDIKFTLDPMPIAFSKVVAPTKVDLAQFTEAERINILAGQAQPGMSKKAVIAALGYPPQHQTPSLDSNKWIYWSKRLDKFVVFFRNGSVEDIAK